MSHYPDWKDVQKQWVDRLLHDYNIDGTKNGFGWYEQVQDEFVKGAQKTLMQNIKTIADANPELAKAYFYTTMGDPSSFALRINYHFIAPDSNGNYSVPHGVEIIEIDLAKFRAMVLDGTIKV